MYIPCFDSEDVSPSPAAWCSLPGQDHHACPPLLPCPPPSQGLGRTLQSIAFLLPFLPLSPFTGPGGDVAVHHFLGPLPPPSQGLGKTLQSIAFLAHLHFVRGVKGPHLVVVPLSVMSNW